jgi:hypothetical protein
MQVCVEHIHQASTWPPEVSGVYRALGSPLPSWCSKGPYQFVSSAVLPLLPELLEVSLHGDDSRNSPQPLLSDVFNLTLSTVADIRSIRAYYHSTPSTIPFVLGLIRGLVHACTKEAVILYSSVYMPIATWAHISFLTVQRLRSCVPAHRRRRVVSMESPPFSPATSSKAVPKTPARLQLP